MPMRSLRPCAQPGCPALVRDEPRCAACRRPRPSAAARGYNWKWAKASKAYLAQNPRCACGKDCCPDGCNRPSEVTDHKIPHRGDQRIFWDQGNWQPLAKVCHDRKTARTDGQFGR